ncbi:hypothetical protein GYM68_07860 [Lactobacillus panisapium]|uniref:hypothetical protein n=1 Tax=Lactobacillus panisapium TaxID=2012495 RepID=UPI001C6A134D|nr:hypothetical protein [Lactobacillus panisapium]QYN59157.1 hypothetical protein GYM68_07860 [Lactobacillus panisapium]
MALTIPTRLLIPLIPWFTNFCKAISNLALLLAFGCLVYWILLNKADVKYYISRLIGNKTKDQVIDLNPVLGRKFRTFLVETDIVIQDPNRLDSVYVPRFEQASDGRLKIEAIGDLRKKLVSESFIWSLESYFNRNGVGVFVQNANYRLDGYVYFTLFKETKSDRMSF